MQGFLRSRWSVEMTGLGNGFISTTVVLRADARCSAPVALLGVRHNLASMR